MLVAGEWVCGERQIAVENPYTGEIVGSVPFATRVDVERALASAAQGVGVMGSLSGAERASLLEGAATLCERESEKLASLIVSEQGKTVAEAGREAGRVPSLLRLCAGEARRITGETLPLDASPEGHGKLGLTLRIPAGIVVAITPFNYPLLLVAHKVGPALAAGNAVILKPFSLTPLTALAFVRLLLEAGYPPSAIQCLTGSGAAVGAQLCADDRVRVVSFTGSRDAGREIAARAGIKRLCLELGANCPTVVMPDADVAAAAAGIAVGGYVNAGQVCISAQRVLVGREVYDDFLDDLTSRVVTIRAGDPASPDSRMGPLISEAEAERVSSIIAEAMAAGSRLLAGGERNGALHQATVVADVRPETRLFRDELFGPAVAVTPFQSLDDALRLVNEGMYGLGASVYTRDVDTAVRFARVADAGIVHINSSPLWRADGMPYGGLKQSGVGKEGPRYAVEEMTDAKTVIFHPRSQG